MMVGFNVAPGLALKPPNGCQGTAVKEARQIIPKTSKGIIALLPCNPLDVTPVSFDEVAFTMKLGV